MVGVSARHLLALNESEALIKLHMCDSFGRRGRFELPAAAARQKTSGSSGRKHRRTSQGINSFTHSCFLPFL